MASGERRCRSAYFADRSPSRSRGAGGRGTGASTPLDRCIGLSRTKLGGSDAVHARARRDHGDAGQRRGADRRRGATQRPASNTAAATGWLERSLTGSTTLAGQVPLAVSQGTADYEHRHPADALISLSFAFPLRDTAALDALIAQQAKYAPVPHPRPAGLRRVLAAAGAGRRAARLAAGRRASASRTSAPTGSR